MINKIETLEKKREEIDLEIEKEIKKAKSKEKEIFLPKNFKQTSSTLKCPKCGGTVVHYLNHLIKPIGGYDLHTLICLRCRTEWEPPK